MFLILLFIVMFFVCTKDWKLYINHKHRTNLEIALFDSVLLFVIIILVLFWS